MISLLLSSTQSPPPQQHHQQQHCHDYRRRCCYRLPSMWWNIINIVSAVIRINVAMSMYSVVARSVHDANELSSTRLRHRQIIVRGDDNDINNVNNATNPYQWRLSNILLEQRFTFPGTFHLVKANQENIKLADLRVGPRFRNGDVINIELYGGRSYQYSLYIDTNMPYGYVTFSYDTTYRYHLVYNDSHVPYSMSTHDDNNRYEPVPMFNMVGNYTILVTGYSQGGGDAVVASMNLSFSIIHDDSRATRISSTSSSTAKNRIPKPNDQN